MKTFSTVKYHVLQDIGRRVPLERLPVVVIPFHNRQIRYVHESYIPKGRGGRSSFSGVVATVFGSTGYLGHAVLNHLGTTGASVMIPYRGTFDRVQRMRVMSDLGQFIFREKFSIRQDDDVIREFIEHSNCVINLVKTRVPTNHYTMEEVNIEWPKRLARLVAEKDDGTRLIHVTHLNCHQQEGRAVSNILRQDNIAENELKKYPNSIMVRCSGVHGYLDHYTRLLLSDRFEDLWKAGSLPALYDAGHSTIVQPVYLSDAAEGIARLSRHPDAPGHTFEFVGPDRYTLHDLVEHLYDAVGRMFQDYNTIGPLDRSKATFMQSVMHKFVELYFWKRFKPRIWLPRALDMITRHGSDYSPWMTFDFYKQLHITDRTTGAPGLRELGIEPCEIEEKAFEYLDGVEIEYHGRRTGQLILQELGMGQSNFVEKEQVGDFTPRTGKIIPRVFDEPTKVDPHTRAVAT